MAVIPVKLTNQIYKMNKSTLSKLVLEKYINPYFIETGTQYGYATAIAIELGFEKIISIELDSKLQENNINTFQNYISNGIVNLITGDSLTELIKIIPIIDKPCTFWLDAHVDKGPLGVKKCPLYEELDAIQSSSIKTHTIMIDDLRIIGNGGWGANVSLNSIKEKIISINPNYKIVLEDGHVPNDILVAYI